MIAVLVYGLCAVLSAAVAALLWRSQRIARSRLVGWTALCFSGLTVSNLLLVLDKLVLVDADMTVLRQSVSLASIGVLLYGLVYEER
jgi:hypothetical protein